MRRAAETAEIVVARYSAGFALKAIAWDLGITPQRAYACVAQHKPGALKDIRARRRAATAAMVQEHLDAGMSRRAVALDMGVTTETVRQLVGSPLRVETEWTADLIRKLRKAWAAGLSTRLIGLRLGVSKNAVVGKAHRLGLPKRKGAIKRKEPAMEEAA